VAAADGLGVPRGGLHRHGPAGGIVSFTVAQALLVGLLGSSAAFAPLVADTSLWFVKRRGIAVAICASGNYLAGAVWPPIAQHFVETVGWRQTYIGMGIFCGVTMALLALFFRARPPALAEAPVGRASAMRCRATRRAPSA
jgi:MFS family permease